jgi:hypothetical protein
MTPFARIMLLLSLGGVAIALVPYSVSLWDWDAWVARRAEGHTTKESPTLPAKQSVITHCNLDPTLRLRTRARQDGIETVRVEYLKEVHREMRRLLQAEGMPLNRDGRSPALHAGWGVMTWAEAWSMEEARSIYCGAAVPKYFEEDVWQRILAAARYAKSIQDKEYLEIQQTRDILADDPNFVEQQRISEYLAPRLRVLILQNQIISSSQENFFAAMADLAKIAKRKDLVEHVFQVYGKPLPMRNEYFQRIGELKTADDFWNYGSPYYERRYGLPKPVVYKPMPVRPSVPLTEEEQQAIRTLYVSLLDAIVAADKEQILSFSADADLAQFEKKVDKSWTNSKLYSYDLSNARFEFWREKKDGPIEFKVEDMKFERDFGGERRQVKSRKTLQVVFQDGKPKFQFLAKP